MVLELSLAQIFPEKINKMLSLNNLGFIDVLSTVCLYVGVFYDLWGYPVDWSKPEDGWDEKKRRNLMDLTDFNLNQWATEKRHTDLGYLKMPIPDELYKLLLRERKMETDFPYEECVQSAFTNCKGIEISPG